ncbi:uncharacterized protein BO96DRAFT_254828 [Aspergillus niger CBS 101883]|uniref:uncharacterized protein n=1 Tax=Aspergillus lacticoffeatus (strain CBS 101883) TaxID=1450533 RepID=UPI000D800555|nr:uncharacterized protein BO96DRAFT_254828 [Aspergillus niger CBS 101883]PYH58133.1 hypothetical protein BO96DRAFT_254828 [Aspergillus niger CBS 101883]
MYQIDLHNHHEPEGNTNCSDRPSKHKRAFRSGCHFLGKKRKRLSEALYIKNKGANSAIRTRHLLDGVYCTRHFYLHMKPVKVTKKTGSFSLIERVILSAGAMLIFSVSFQIDQMPEGNSTSLR